MLHLKLTTPYDYDLVVVGGGPAGSATAGHAARLGLKVALIDQHNFPRDKVCGDFVGPAALLELRRLGVTQFPAFQETNLIHSAALHLDGKQLISSLMPDMPGMPAHGVVVPREILDNWIVQAAHLAGAQVYEGYRVKGYELDGDGVLVSGQGQKGTRQWRARLLVGADGSSSAIARQMHRRLASAYNRIIAVRAYYEGINGPADQADLYFSADSFPGYYWLFPSGEGQANVGVGMLRQTLPPVEERLPDMLERLIETDPAFAARLAGARRKGKIVGWPLATYDPALPLADERVILVGDAAGLINPLNGEGIQYALLSGRWAVETIAIAAQSGDFSRTALSAYTRRVSQELRYDMALSSLIVQLIRNRNLNPLWMQALRVIVSRARLDSNYAARTGGVLAGLAPASSVLSVPVIGGTLQQAVLSAGVGSLKHTLRGPTHLLKFGMGTLTSGVDIALESMRHPLELARWGGGVAANTVELASQVLGQLAQEPLRPETFDPSPAPLRLRLH
jgi:geranylgeranyl reductase family protein